MHLLRQRSRHRRLVRRCPLPSPTRRAIPARRRGRARHRNERSRGERLDGRPRPTCPRSTYLLPDLPPARTTRWRGQSRRHPLSASQDGWTRTRYSHLTQQAETFLQSASPTSLLIWPRYSSQRLYPAQIVDSTLVVNPAHLSRAHTAGTFAKVVVHPTPRSELERTMDVDGGLEDMAEHRIWERARSEIWRI